MPSPLLVFFSIGFGLPAWYWLKVANRYSEELLELINQYGWQPKLIVALIAMGYVAVLGLFFSGPALRCLGILRRRWIK